MKRSKVLRLTLAGAALLVAVGVGGSWAHEPPTKHHHDLRGVITKVEPEKNQFEIKTDTDHVALCLIDEKTKLRRGDKPIALKDVRPGERARCHCAARRDGRHYSQSLLLEPEKEKKK